MQGVESLDTSDEDRNIPSRFSLANTRYVALSGPIFRPPARHATTKPCGNVQANVFSITYRLQTERQLGQRCLSGPTQAYDKQLLSRIGGPNSPNRDGSTPQSGFNKFVGSLKPLALPEHGSSSFDPPRTQWPNPPQSGISPGAGFRNLVFGIGSMQSPYSARPHNSSIDGSYLPNFATLSQRSSVDQGVFPEREFGIEENCMRDLNIRNRSPGPSDELQLGGKGTKRKASSPPPVIAREDRPSGTVYDLENRHSVQTLINTSSQTVRYSQIQGLVSSNSSASHKSGYSSSSNLSIASSITSHGSAVSASIDADFTSVSPYAASHTHNRSRHSSLLQSLQSKLSENIEQVQEFFVCECCPKKPKKFATKEELE